MKFVTKKYTRPVLLANIKKLPVSAFVSQTTLANALSPRAGKNSAQFSYLKKYVSTKVFSSTSGQQLKRVILATLQNQ